MNEGKEYMALIVIAVFVFFSLGFLAASVRYENKLLTCCKLCQEYGIKW